MGRPLIVLAIAALGIAAGAFSLDVARDDPSYWFAGRSAAAGVAFVAAGWAAIGGGLAAWLRRPASRSGPLLVAAGFAWFLLEWNNPGIGSSAAFTVGLVGYAACAPLIAHAVLAHRSGQLGSHVERVALAVAYAGAVVVLGFLPAIFFDPQAQNCGQCPRNLVVVANRGDLAEDLTRAGVYLGLAWALALTVLLIWKLGRELRARRSVAAAVPAAGAVYLGQVAAWYASSLDDGLLASGSIQRQLWLGQAAALVALPAVIAWSWVRSRRARSAVARLVLELVQAPPPGGLRDAFAAIVGDPDLTLAYPLDDSGRLVDALGRPVELASGREQTALARDGRTVAVLAHSPGLLDDEQLVDELAATARLALENERLQAEVRARLEELRRSRARIVEAGDAERKRLERNLHDGAQQRLVTLSLTLRLLRSQLPADTDSHLVGRVDEADAELHEAIAELRELAHGIFPAVLADEGFAAAVGALSEEARVPIRIGRLPDDRCSAAAETTAYTVVAEAARAATKAVSIDAEQTAGLLVVDVETSADRIDLVALEDRVRALDGQLDVRRSETGRITIRAELPCAS